MLNKITRVFPKLPAIQLWHLYQLLLSFCFLDYTEFIDFIIYMKLMDDAVFTGISYINVSTIGGFKRIEIKLNWKNREIIRIHCYLFTLPYDVSTEQIITFVQAWNDNLIDSVKNSNGNASGVPQINSMSPPIDFNHYEEARTLGCLEWQPAITVIDMMVT